MKGATVFSTSFLLLAIMQAAMCVDPQNFFSGLNGNLTKIVWAHAVNSQEKLAKALNSSDVMMLEADVSMGHLTTNSTNKEKIPIMAHPPNETSDLSLESFLQQVREKNVTKGVKLDFKSTEAVQASKTILESLNNSTKIPVFLNADVIDGPVNATANVNVATFLEITKSLSNCILSVGWATNHTDAANNTNVQYTEEQVQQMVGNLTKQNVSQVVTYPVRAVFAVGNATVMKNLLEKSSKLKSATLSIWSAKEDVVNAEQLSNLVKDIGVDKVYVDVPEDLMKKLNFSKSNSNKNIASSMLAIPLVISTLLSLFIQRV